jgi:hypothetical protein
LNLTIHLKSHSRGVVDVVAVERELRFEPERVARAEPDRLESEGGAGRHDRVPDGSGVRIEGIDFEPVLARIARPGDQAFFAHDLAEGGVEGFHRGQGDIGQGLEDLDGLPPLEGDLAVPVGRVVQGDVEAAAHGLDVGVVLVGVGRVDDQQIELRVDAIDEHVVHVRPAIREQARVLDVARRQARRVAAVRQARCSSMMPLYSTGMSQPQNSIMWAPSFRWLALKRVCFMRAVL